MVIAHALATASMVGVIWFVQLVHYPLMARVSPAEFPSFEREHQRRTTWVVAPPMLVEAVTACSLPFLRPVALPFAGLVLLALIWASTFFVQVPLHTMLSRGFDATAHRRLVTSNWLRTVLWTLRGGLAGWMMVTI